MDNNCHRCGFLGHRSNSKQCVLHKTYKTPGEIQKWETENKKPYVDFDAQVFKLDRLTENATKEDLEAIVQLLQTKMQALTTTEDESAGSKNTIATAVGNTIQAEKQLQARGKKVEEMKASMTKKATAALAAPVAAPVAATVAAAAATVAATASDDDDIPEYFLQAAEEAAKEIEELAKHAVKKTTMKAPKRK